MFVFVAFIWFPHVIMEERKKSGLKTLSMEPRFCSMTFCLFHSFILCGVPSVVVVLPYRTATALRQLAQQKHTILAVTTHRSVSSSVVTAEASASETATVKQPADANSWLCRIAKKNGACGNRLNSDVYPPQEKVYCPDGFCCSKTACLGGCGSWCTDSWALCSSSVVYHTEWSYGNCNCKRFAQRCHREADCTLLAHDNGGAYCHCKRGFLGDGKRCTKDHCDGNPCYPGTCKNIAGSYMCECPDSHKLETVDNREVCTEKRDYCRDFPCGPSYMVEKCTNKEDGYTCECKEGYAVKNDQCQAVDLCEDSPCGSREAVHSCRTEYTPRPRYRCQCKDGYEVHLSSDGEGEVCAKNWCYDNPCGPTDRVKDCKSTTDGYSCLCRDNYEMEKDSYGHEKCVEKDLCSSEPCGPPDAVKRCYTEGSNYRCECQPGYAESVNTEGQGRCVKGDLCSLGTCGNEEAVLRCTASGSDYTCVCREPEFLLGMQDGMKKCLSKRACIENCGHMEAVEQCQIEKGSFVCKCNAGFSLTYSEGKQKCTREDICKTAPCGPDEAVEDCRPNDVGAFSPYTCTCKSNYEKRTQDDDSEVCAERGSCVGSPCGPRDTVKACKEGKDEYSCQCAENYVEGRLGGKARCVLSGAEGLSNTAIAGSIVGGLLLIGSVGAGIAYSRRRRENEDDVDDRYRPPHPGVPPRPFPV